MSTPFEYHRLDGAWSSTMVRSAITQPLDAYRMYVARTADPDETGPALRIGAGYHACCAGWPGAPYPSLYRVDAGSINSNDYRHAMRTFGRTSVVLLGKEFDLVELMFRATLELQTPAADDFRTLLQMEGPVEHAIRWLGPGGLPCKALIDKLIVTGPLGPTVVEWKTANDPDPAQWKRDAAKFNYDLQAAHLRAAVESMLGVKPHVLFGVIGSAPPIRISMNQFDQETMEEADEDWALGAFEIAERLKTPGDASLWMHSWEQSLNTISRPKYAKRKKRRQGR